MKKPAINIIAALQKKDRAIGRGNKLLWHISDDLKRFKRLTTGHHIIMGRKTYESIGRPLPNRTNIILTRNPEYRQEGCVTCTSLEQALHIAQQDADSEVFVIGGGEIYKQAVSHASKLYLTLVDADEPADTFFPEYTEFTKEIFREDHADNMPSYSFVELEK